MKTPMFVMLAAVAMIATPLANAGTAAHPHTHTFVGVSAQDAQIHVDSNGIAFDSAVDTAVVGLCADVTPVLSAITPPTVFRDGDTETGIGGGCFAFTTVYGSDAGTTVTVFGQDIVGSINTVYVACVDVNGDGLCTPDLGGDQYNLCENGVSLTHGGSCQVYEDPAAANPYVYVLVLAGVTVDASGVTPTAAVAGFLFLSN